MVTAPIVLLIAVASTPDGVAMADEAAAACLQALPAGAKTVVRTVAAAPDDADLDAAAAATDATATVIVTWRDAARLVGDVRVRAAAHAGGPPRQTERTIVFSARDLPAERGRALGLVIASILVEDRAAGGPAAGMASGPPPLSGGAVDTEIPPVLAGSGRPAPAAPTWALEANVTTAVDAQEDFDDTIGGMIALRRALTARWALRAGLGFRVADLDGADATARTTLGALGVAWSSPAFTAGRGLGFAARADLLGVREAIKRDDFDAAGLDGHWTAGADLLGQVGLGLSSGTSLVCGGGFEGFLSGESLATPSRAPATILRGRVIFELGVLARF
ncbi:MAG TPA: hypothetical protein VHO06_27385 [Polyangia bacterium]|nr:hypothetical protein [Polyangia bacterium]